MSLVINTGDAVYETLDGEVVVVNLKLGRYHSLTDSGALLWAGLQDGLSKEELAALLTLHYVVEAETALSCTETFLEQLEANGLVIEGPSASKTATGVTAVEPVVDRRPFHPPVLATHDDMEGLLLLDPVHEVADEGWPATKS